MPRPMTDTEIRRFMATGSRTGKLATVRADGAPHVAPIWFDFDTAGRAVFLTWATSVKAYNMRRDPRVSISVDLEEMPYAWTRLDGTVTFSQDPADLVHWGTETSRRYVGDERAREYGIRNGVAGEMVVWVTPTRLVGEDDLAG